MFFLLVVCILSWGLNGCTERQHRNPLDPLRSNPEDVLEPLAVMAGNGEVVLRWDFSHFDDISGYQLYRRVGSETFKLVAPLAPEILEFVDSDVENGTTYDYRLALQIQGEDEFFVDGFLRATPGAEICWVGDRSSGLVWKISPDGRSAQFGRGRFPDLSGLALNRRDGAVWVSDRLVVGLSRIGAEAEAEIKNYHAEIGAAGPLSIDSDRGIAWVIDSEDKQVKFFELTAVADTLELFTVDAHFVEPAHLAAWDNHCWIVDDQVGRVLFYHRDGERRVEFGDLEEPGEVAAGSADLAWVLVRQGGGVMRLDGAAPEAREIALPFAPAWDLEVDRENGECWVVGDGHLAVFNRDGTLLLHQADIEGGQGLALDEVHRRVWIGRSGFLSKFTLEGQGLSLLGGFSTPLLVEVDPGRF
jgi:hypothetical protein